MKPAEITIAKDLAALAVNTIKFLSIDQVEKAHSGHPGLPMGAADYAFVLWAKYLKHDPKDPHWIDRDRFILSAGHGSALLYSLLHLTGYDLSLEELQRFRQWDSKTPGHPEVHLTPGVECTTGPLGQGFATGVGMALAAKMAEARFPGLFNHRIWAIVSDGDIMEGVAAEAASLAGHLQLGNLKYLYDANDITLDGRLDDSMSENVAERFHAYGWATKTIDGHNHDAIAEGLDWALAENSKPVMLICRTHIGHGAPNKHDTHKVHGEPLGKEENEATRKNLNWPLDKTFYVPDDVRNWFNQRAETLHQERVAWDSHEQTWLNKNPDKLALYTALKDRTVPSDLFDQLLAAIPKDTDATRSLAGAIQQKAAALVPSLVGGDADLGGSTKTPIKGSSSVTAKEFSGKNLKFGIREHAMGSMANGFSLYGMFIPFTATFLTFSDYMRGAVRLASLSELQVIHVFTHDSIFLGEDGPTHQSVEHVSALRLIPNTNVWRPADGIECAAAWASALEHTHGPTELIFSRQKVAVLPARSSLKEVRCGGYVLVKESGPKIDLILIATGSEVGLALETAKLLTNEGKSVRVVSMPCAEVFERQSQQYRDSVLPKGTKRVSIEAGRTDYWYKWVGLEGLCIGMDRFGASAPASVLAEKFGLTAPQIADKVRAWLSA